MGIITYKAIPLDIPESYKLTLIELGDDCCKLRKIVERDPRSAANKLAYEESIKTLAKFESSLRKQFGIEVSRPEILPVQPPSRIEMRKAA